MEIHITGLSAPKLGSSGEKLSGLLEGGKKKKKKGVRQIASDSGVK